MDLFTVLESEFSKIYGKYEGERLLRTVLPGIMGDFRKMLSDARPGSTVREEYRMEDGKCTVVLTGEKRVKEGKITGISVNGREYIFPSDL